MLEAQNDYQQHESHQAQHTGYPLSPAIDAGESTSA